MNKLKRKHWIGIVVALLLFWIIGNSISQPGVNDLTGDFKEVALYRNENNTGPVVRIYAVTTTDTLWSEMEQYGNFMPHTKYGTTKVYFFPAGAPVPAKLVPGDDNFEDELKPYCLAVFEKNAMSAVSFRKYPYGRNQ
ncbi:hypothetical protein [Telluribacter sp. SYSU D00476]|uniref:hypothetical protein n=1 Tax=Telluribacter sp. SYSU D00476 TaxID=2811430 RepID=UPI001FF1207E|nr:hypothetical protein [Telluribacter sp. SYSU D00476]